VRNRVGEETFAADPYPRQRLVAVGEVQEVDWYYTVRLEAFQGIPFTPAVAMIPERAFDFGLGRFADPCYGTNIQYLYGAHNSARTGWSKRLDVGIGTRWTDRRGWRWELAASLLNALFDPTGTFRPAPGNPKNGCEEPSEVVRESEFILPPIPSVTIRLKL
jgi:hypothetical protein